MKTKVSRHLNYLPLSPFPLDGEGWDGGESPSQYHFSKHGNQERQNDNLSISEVEEAPLHGSIREGKPVEKELRVPIELFSDMVALG